MNKRERRRATIRQKISGTSQRPRLAVFRSLRHIYAQLIDDTVGKTLVAASDQELKAEKSKNKKIEVAQKVGQLLGEKAADKKIKQAVFDRAGFRYAGRLKALADGAREKIKF
ncbi:MAG: large subunit ribosomal protein L18 [Candidatus Berkelbacteria bacterium Licking1014_2]|uniref:Large ribosomal subunit protein uL18 n=1 Tax=Candidatus Berkelbacteria bacterium Licking1014_2 TaxID=2017146 RepID=A0A554LWW7_9BACT|nr:MAG: large subunit ribosomal protein L18 [Candidatus Berkelbacteria bacterium Licking1014_2]